MDQGLIQIHPSTLYGYLEQGEAALKQKAYTHVQLHNF